MSTTSPPNHFCTDSTSDSFQTNVLVEDEELGTNGMKFGRGRDPVQDASPNLPSSTASAGHSDSLSRQQRDRDVITCTEGTTSAGEVVSQLSDGGRSSVEVTRQQYSRFTDVSRDRHPTNDDALSTAEVVTENCDWQFYATRRVNVTLLLDILLARKHRDHAARDFLLSLPASVLKKYEVFGRQYPLFICLDIAS